MEAIAAALTTTTAPVELLEYIDARRVEELAASILGKHVPISILLLYTVLIPRRMRDTGSFEVGFTLRVLQEYFLPGASSATKTSIHNSLQVSKPCSTNSMPASRTAAEELLVI